MTRWERGQSTVEFALCLPFVALLVAVLVQIGLLSVDTTRVWHAAREAARIAAVDGDPSAIRDAAEGAGLSPLEIEVDPGPSDRAQGAPVVVTVRHLRSVEIPVLGSLVPDLPLSAKVAMRIETP